MNKVELMKLRIEDYTERIQEEREHKQVLNDLLVRMWDELTEKEKEAVIHGVVLVEDKILDLVAKRSVVREKLKAREKLLKE